jgi:hypothetical protein
MLCRFATLSDVPGVCELLREFSQASRVGFRTWRADSDTPRLYRMVQHWQINHYVRVALQDDQIVGTLIAEHGQDFWDPERRILQERAWYVAQSHRGSRAGALLWQNWHNDTTRYLEQGRVTAVLLSTQGPDTNFDPGRRGWRLIEQTWIKE